MQRFGQDIRYALRSLRKNPGYSVLAILTLALGIGVNATIFSFIDALLLRPFPVEDSGRLAAIYTSDYSGPAFGQSSYPDYLDLRQGETAFSDVAAYTALPVHLSDGTRTERVAGQIVTGNYFELLGVAARLGRTLTPGDDRLPGAHPVVVLSHGTWRSLFGADPGIVGRELWLNGEPYTVAGVAAENFQGMIRGVPAAFWAPMTMQSQLTNRPDRLESRGSRWLMLVGRLQPNASIEQAQATSNIIASQLHQAYPDAWEDRRDEARRITVIPANKAMLFLDRSAVAHFFGLLMTVVGFVLLLACANVANLFLARASARTREISVRVALGAGRLRLVRQLLTESAVLSLLAGIAGVLAADLGTRLLLSFQPPLPIPIQIDARINTAVVAFAFGLALLSGLLFGVWPALRASRSDLVSGLKQTSASGRSPGRWFWSRNVLLGGQVALSVLLLVGAGLFLRSMTNAMSVDVGFEPHRLLALSLDLETQGYNEARIRAFTRQALDRIEALPGVRSVGLAQLAPLGVSQQRSTVALEGYAPQPNEDMELCFNSVGPGYFDTMGIQILRGQAFTSADRAGTRPVVVVNDALARRYWSGQNPLGKHLSRGGTDYEVVGVTATGKYRSLSEDPLPYFYFALDQVPADTLMLHVRSEGDPRALIEGVRREISALDATLPVYDVKTMEDHLGIALLPLRVLASLLSFFGLLALLLSAVGIYGVMSYVAATRTREFGIRMALGARSRDIAGLVTRQGLAVSIAGIVTGLAAAFGLTRFAASLLFDVSATDPWTLFAVVALLIAAALLASLAPALRAAGLNPMHALRIE